VPRRQPVRTGRILPHYRTTLARPGISTTLTRDRPKPTDPAGDQLAVIIFRDRARPPYPRLGRPHLAPWRVTDGTEPLFERLQPRPSTPSRTWVIILSSSASSQSNRDDHSTYA
jgi:hypothetical protein